MRKIQLLQLGVTLGTVATLAMSACGSGDSSKKGAPCLAGEACAGDSGAAGEVESGGRSGSAPTAGGGAGGVPTAEAGASGAEQAGEAGNVQAGAAGAAGAPGTQCPTGTADCDADPTDCETNTLTDASNCGRCERACGGTAQCTNGVCQGTVILDPTVSSNWCGGAFTATTAYMITCWGNNDLSEVRSAPLEPGASITGTLIRDYKGSNNTGVSVVALRGILVDGNEVFYGLEGNPSNLWKFPLNATGTADVSVGVVAEAAMRFDDLKLVGDTYYWEDNNGTAPGVAVSATIYKRAKTDAASTPLVTGLGLAYNVQVTPTKLVWVEYRQPGATVTPHVYRAPLAGAPVANVEDVATATAGTYLVKQGDYVYWTVKTAKPNGKLQRLKYADDLAKAEDIVTGLDLPEGLISDADYLYFKQKDALYRAPISGGAAEQLSVVIPANDQQATAIFHVNDEYVYFAAGAGFGASTLVRVAK